MTMSRPWYSSGTNGIGGQGITLAIVESSSGAASAAAMNPAIVSGVAGRTRIPPTNSAIGWSRNWNRVATPKLPPPPRIAQNRSGFVSASARSSRPSAVTTSAASEIVDRQAVLADEVADATAEGDPADPDRAGVAEAGRQAVGGDGGRVLGGGQTRSGPGGPAVDVDLERLQVAQVEDDPAVGRAVAGAAVAAAPDRQLETGLARERDHLGDIVGIGDPDDDRRPVVEATHHHGARLVVVGIPRADDPPGEVSPDVGDGDLGRRAGNVHEASSWRFDAGARCVGEPNDARAGAI